MIDETYLALRGWEAYHFDIIGNNKPVYVMSNPTLNVVINRKGLLRDHHVKVTDTSAHPSMITRVQYSEVWPYLMNEVYKFEEKMSISKLEEV